MSNPIEEAQEYIQFHMNSFAKYLKWYMTLFFVISSVLSITLLGMTNPDVMAQSVAMAIALSLFGFIALVILEFIRPQNKLVTLAQICLVSLGFYIGTSIISISLWGNVSYGDIHLLYLGVGMITIISVITFVVSATALFFRLIMYGVIKYVSWYDKTHQIPIPPPSVS